MEAINQHITVVRAGVCSLQDLLRTISRGVAAKDSELKFPSSPLGVEEKSASRNMEKAFSLAYDIKLNRPTHIDISSFG